MYTLNNKADALLGQSAGLREEKSLLPLPGFETRIFLSTVLILVTVLTEQSVVLLSRMFAVSIAYFDSQQERPLMNKRNVAAHSPNLLPWKATSITYYECVCSL